jgi:hypothetical protein
MQASPVYTGIVCITSVVDAGVAPSEPLTVCQGLYSIGTKTIKIKLSVNISSLWCQFRIQKNHFTTVNISLGFAGVNDSGEAMENQIYIHEYLKKY